ncbi:hypothetical protein C7T94_11585 [Pedobacter yulinensis]|uniref:Uncharacterized protein n=1 Tax=Pedobacter yulinensis TaxID=2126353 RepID=A0A2T3HLD0_9SPHI|nr:hypothetical protein C7T94_11585 [Pedobacter yulinensis]
MWLCSEAGQGLVFKDAVRRLLNSAQPIENMRIMFPISSACQAKKKLVRHKNLPFADTNPPGNCTAGMAVQIACNYV